MRLIRSRCMPGLLIARLRGLREAVDDLELGLAQLDGALGHGLLELDVAARDAEALAALGDVARRDGGDHAQREREEGHGHGQDAPVVEGALGDEAGRRRRSRAPPPPPPAGAARRLTSAGRKPSASTMSRPAQRGVPCSGIPRSTVSIALASISGPDIGVSLVGVGWTSCSVGDAAPTTTMRPRTRAGLDLARQQVGERDGVDRPRRAVEVDPRPVLLERRRLDRAARAAGPRRWPACPALRARTRRAAARRRAPRAGCWPPPRRRSRAGTRLRRGRCCRPSRSSPRWPARRCWRGRPR